MQIYFWQKYINISIIKQPVLHFYDRNPETKPIDFSLELLINRRYCIDKILEQIVRRRRAVVEPDQRVQVIRETEIPIVGTVELFLGP